MGARGLTREQQLHPRWKLVGCSFLVLNDLLIHSSAMMQERSRHQRIISLDMRVLLGFFGHPWESVAIPTLWYLLRLLNA